MTDIRKILNIISESSAGASTAGAVASVPSSFTSTQSRVQETTKAPDVLEYGNWENSAASTSNKLKKSREKSAKVVKSIYGDDKQSTTSQEVSESARSWMKQCRQQYGSDVRFFANSDSANESILAKKNGKIVESFNGNLNHIATTEQSVAEGKTGPGLWANIHAKRERIKSGSGERMRKPGSKGAPTAANFKAAASESVTEEFDSEALADEIYNAFETMYPNLARRADERVVHDAIIDVLNYGGGDPDALAQDVARAVKRSMQGVTEGSEKAHGWKIGKMYRGSNEPFDVVYVDATDEKTALAKAHHSLKPNHMQILTVLRKPQGVAEGAEIKIPTDDGITMQDIRLMAGEGKLTKKTVLQAIAIIRKQREERAVTEGDFDQWGGEIKTPTGKKQKYEMMLSNGKAKKFVASNDREAKSIAKGHGAKSVIKIKGNVPAGSVSEGSREQVDPNTVWEVCFDYGPHQSDKVKVRASSQEEAEQKGMRAAKKLGHRFPQLNWAMPTDQGVSEGWKDKVAGAALGAAALGGIGLGIANSPMAHIDGKQIHMAMPGKIPDNAKLVTDDDGKKIYVWRSYPIKNSPGNTKGHLVYRPAEDVKEDVAEGLGKDIKRLATGKDVKSRAGQEIAKSQDASMKGDNKTANKHFKRYDKLDKLANKGVAEGTSYNIDQDDLDDFTPDEIERIKNAHFPDTLRDNLRAAKKQKANQDHLDKLKGSSDGSDSKHISPVGNSSDNTYEGVAKGNTTISRVKEYEATVYYSSTGSSHTKLYPFTQAQADEVGGVLTPAGLNVALAQKLCDNWTRRGNHGDIRYSYKLPINKTTIDYAISKANNKQGVAEGERMKTASGMYRDQHTGVAYRGKTGQDGNDSYMTPDYLIQKYQERLAQIASGPYKRPKEVAQLKSRIAKLQGQQGVAEGSELTVQQHKSPYEGAEVGEYTTMFNASPNSAQRFAKHIISKGGKARIGKRGQDYYVYHNVLMSKEDWRKSEQQGVAEGNLNEFAPGNGDDSGNNQISLETVAKIIAMEFGNNVIVTKGKNKDQPSFTISPKNQFDKKIKVWSTLNPRTKQVNTTYNTILYIDGTGKHVEKAKLSTYTNALSTAKLLKKQQGVAEGFDSAAFDRHMDKLRAQKELEKTDPMRAMVNKMKSDYDYQEKSKSKSKQDDERQITDPFHPSQGVNIGEQDVTEGSLEEYGDTKKGQKILTKVHKRAVGRAIKAADQGDAQSAKKNQDTANRAWERFGPSFGGGVAEAKFEYKPYLSSDITDPEEYKRWRDQREIESVFGDTPQHIRRARGGMYKKSIATPRQWKMLFDLTDDQGRFLPRMSKGHAAGVADKKAGKDINSNPFTPGSDEHKDWVGGWKSIKETNDYFRHREREEGQNQLQSTQLDELSTEKLAQYKKAAGASASAADKQGDFKKGNKRFSGIVKATNKQFANDAKRNKPDEKLDENDIIVSPHAIEKMYNDLMSKTSGREDHEVQMAKGDLVNAGKNAVEIYQHIRDVSEEDGLEGWVQEKIIKATDYLNTVKNYFDSKQIESIDGVTPGTHMFTSESVDSSKDTVEMDIPFLIRALEYAREDAKEDVDLHNVVEHMIDAAMKGKTLTMQDYAAIFGSNQTSKKN